MITRSFPTLRMTSVVAALLLLIAACENGTGTLPDGTLPATALSMGQVHIAPQTRTAEEPTYFVKDDALRILINGTEASTTAWNGTGFGNLTPAIYLEDVHDPTGQAPPTLTAECGSAELVPNQSTADLVHSADYISGGLTVNTGDKTLNAASMTHQHTQLILQIKKGNGWERADNFAEHFTTLYIYTTTGGETVTPLVEAADAQATITCILPEGKVVTTTDTPILTLTVPREDGNDGGTRTLRLTEAITAEAGKSITITAEYDKMGTFGGITATLAEWKDEVYDEVLEGLTEAERKSRKEKQRFLAWAQGDNWNSDFTLACDIDLKNKPFEPIGDYSNYFTHTFDGGGHTISGLKIDKSGDHYVGLFGVIDYGGTVRNLAVEGVISGGGYTGGIAGVNGGTIAGCTFNGTVTGLDRVGGITGMNGGGRIAGCCVTPQSTISGPSYVGGIAGESFARIIACLADGVTIKGTDTNTRLGGITGYNGDHLVACVAATTTEADNTYVGGITGFNGYDAIVTTCYWQTGKGYSKAIGFDNNTDNPQEKYCPSFTTLKATDVDALNTAIDDWNEDPDNDKCAYQWASTTTNTAGAIPVPTNEQETNNNN